MSIVYQRNFASDLGDFVLGQGWYEDSGVDIYNDDTGVGDGSECLNEVAIGIVALTEYKVTVVGNTGDSIAGNGYVHLGNAGSTLVLPYSQSGPFIGNVTSGSTPYVELMAGDYVTHIVSITVETIDVTPPAKATTPSPADDATAVSIAANLGWTNGAGAVTVNVYLAKVGEAYGSAVSTGTLVTSYNPPVDFDAGTEYKWRVDGVNEGGTTQGDEWTFRTAYAAAGAATTPSPADDAAAVAISTNLSWVNGSGTVKVDLWFGIVGNLAKVIDGQLATSYDPPANLSYSTEYAWRVDTYNADDVKTSGTEWSFTTIVEAPEQATTPDPGNATANVAADSSLSWTNGSRTTTVDAYLGTDPDALVKVIDNESAEEYVPNSDFEYGTTYYWRVDCKNVGGTTAGVVWSFTTANYVGIAPSALIANLLVQVAAVMTSPLDEADWSLYIGHMPDVKRNVGCVYDTVGILDGRSMRDGRVVEHSGIQLRTRSFNYADAFSKATELRDVMNAILNVTVSVDSNQFLICAASERTPVTYIGLDEERRFNFTVNYTVTIEKL